jgi:hypothetical protein
VGKILIFVHSDDRKARSCARKILAQARASDGRAAQRELISCL